jgi:hypothetical protein
MNHLSPAQLSAAVMLQEPTERQPLNIRTMAFDVGTFDLLKQMQRQLESRIRRDTSNAEVVKYLIHTHPEALDSAGIPALSTSCDPRATGGVGRLR